MALTPELRFRVGVLITHPIQYYSPWFRQLAQHIELEVFYAHRQDQQGQADAGFGVLFEWDVPLLDGYSYRWLKNVSRKPGLAHFRGCDTPELSDLITPDRFDAFLVVGWYKKCHWQAIRACWKRNVPVLMRGDSQRLMVTSRLNALLKAVPYRWFLPKLDAYLYVGQRNREYLQHYGVTDDQLFFCPHFVDNEFFGRRAAEARADGRSDNIRSQCGGAGDAFVALFVGKLIEKKRPGHFIRAVLKAAKSNPHIRGLVVGSGPLEEECRRLASGSSQILFAGFQNQSQLPAYYAAADVLVLPSQGTETWGLVVNEAMACGTPCIVSSECGCSEDLIHHGETGFLCDGKNVQSLTDQMLRAASLSPQQRKELSQRVEQTIQRYTMSAATAGLLDAMSKKCQSRVTSP